MLLKRIHTSFITEATGSAQNLLWTGDFVTWLLKSPLGGVTLGWLYVYSSYVAVLTYVTRVEFTCMATWLPYSSHD